MQKTERLRLSIGGHARVLGPGMTEAGAAYGHPTPQDAYAAAREAGAVKVIIPSVGYKADLSDARGRVGMAGSQSPKHPQAGWPF